MWCVAERDEEYIRRMEDILAVYEKPLSEREPVVCVDEKPVVLHQEVRPSRAMRPGRIARRDGEYQRCGTANVFCGVEPKAGQYFPKVTANRSSPKFADYLLEVAIRYPGADVIHLVLDNLSSHTRKAVVERFGEKLICSISCRSLRNEYRICSNRARSSFSPAESTAVPAARTAPRNAPTTLADPGPPSPESAAADDPTESALPGLNS